MENPWKFEKFSGIFLVSIDSFIDIRKIRFWIVFNLFYCCCVKKRICIFFDLVSNYVCLVFN